MHIQTHLLSGWCFGNLLGLDKRGRSLAILAAGLPDIDGLGILFGPIYYWKYHHLVCHNLLFAFTFSVIHAYFSEQRLKAFFTFILLFHLHFLMDYFGSGTGWLIYYFWPFSNHGIDNPIGWPFLSWQNTATGVIFTVWMIGIAVYQKRTFFECIAPKLNEQLAESASKLRLNIDKLFAYKNK